MLRVAGPCVHTWPAWAHWGLELLAAQGDVSTVSCTMV